MTDVDGTLTDESDSISSVVSGSIRRLEDDGVIVGLVSGRTLPGLESLASDLEISGPIIAENGGVARLNIHSKLLDMGHSRKPALEALEKIRTLFPDAIEEREDNKFRMVDVVLWSHGVDVNELRRHLDDADLIDSGYILHLVQKGISKGRTLSMLLRHIADGRLSTEDVMVFGDSLTDLSLFEMFPHSVLIINPRHAPEHIERLHNVCRYISELSLGYGFTQVASHIMDGRINPEAVK
jgi:hydroxymethylpyrimidine pyrophosphatase-like HAD family hydrolase